MRRALEIALSACALVTASGPSFAHAYQNPERFAAGVDIGGSAGRYFTGSLVDSYTCSVCHAPSASPNVQIYGLPEDGYVPGTIYRVLVDWPDDLERVGVNMEMTDTLGNPLGQWLPPDDATLTDADRCGLIGDGTTGVNLAPLPGRSLVTVSECGQHQATLLWRAPDLNELPRDAWFSGSLLSSNHDESLEGDASTDFSRALHVAGTDLVKRGDVYARCEVRSPGAPADRSTLRLALFAAALVVLWRRRRAWAQIERSSASSAKRSMS